MNTVHPVEVVKLRDGSGVEVRELSWIKALEFMSQLSAHAQEIVEPLTAEIAKCEDRRPFPPSLKQGVQMEEYLAEMVKWEEARRQVIGRVLLSQVQKIITGSGSLAEFLLTHSVKLDPDRLNALGAADALRLLESAIGLTLNEEILSRGKAVAARVLAAFTPAAVSTKG